MCGIAGVINLNPHLQLTESDSNKVVHMLSMIKHRGPDQTNIIATSDYVLGHVRLTIIGDDLGIQPISDGIHSLVFNGEIYNYQELSQTMKGMQDIESDTYILFKYLKKSRQFDLQLLNGVFSFCYIDDEYIYVARDRYGEKPLFYTILNNCLYFASEIKAFSGITNLRIKLPLLYPELETSFGDSTIFDSVYSVEAGSYLKINRVSKMVEKHRYYSFPLYEENNNESYLLEKLRWLVDDAIRLRIPSSHKYGVYISGGLDSSIIALKTQPTSLYTYLPNNENVPSEEKYADIVAKSMVASRYAKVASVDKDFFRNFIKTVYANGGPTTTFAAYSQYMLAKRTYQDDMRVILGGMGADEFFNGYTRHAIAFFPLHLLDEEMQKQYRPLIEKGHNKEIKNSIMDIYMNILNRKKGISKALKTEVEAIFQKYGETLASLGISDASFTLPPLLHSDDHLNMIWNIESRSPLMDYRIVEFALSLPTQFKIKYDSQTKSLSLKYLLKEAYKDVLPQEIYARTDKVGFSSPINELLKTDLKKSVEVSIGLLQQ